MLGSCAARLTSSLQASGSCESAQKTQWAKATQRSSPAGFSGEETWEDWALGDAWPQWAGASWTDRSWG